MKQKSVFHAAGLRSTPGRERVLATLAGGDCLSARDIWDRLLAERERVGFATVYRALSALCDAGLARKILSENGTLYESAQDDALPQLVCSRCGKVEDIDDPALLRYNTSVMRNRALNDGDSLLLYANCRRKECDDDK